MKRSNKHPKRIPPPRDPHPPRDPAPALARAEAARQRAERALSQYWSLIETLLGSSPDLYAVKSVEGVYQAASGRFCAFAGCSEEDLRGRSDAELFPREIANTLRRHDAAVLSSAQSYVWEQPIATEQGSALYQIVKSPILHGGKHCAGILLTLRDITELRRLQRQVGILARAGGEAAWVLDAQGNIVDVDANYCAWTGHNREELLGRNLHEVEGLTTPEDISLRQRRIFEAGWGEFKSLHRTKDGRILEFEVRSVYMPVHGGRYYRYFTEVQNTASLDSADPGPRTQDRSRRVINLNETVRQALALLGDILPPGVQIDQDLEPRLLNSVANHAQLAQTLINLLTNAIEAVDGKGRITLSTRNIEITEDLVRAYPRLRPGAYVFVSVEDTGRGISAKLLDKIFEPFFTTKFKGRGMGLAAAWRNVKEHGGHIAVRSREGQGSTFIMYLPGTNAPADTPNAWVQPPTGTETVLLIDGGGYQLAEAREVLERLAYRVLVAHDTREAAALAGTYPGAIHVALLDTESREQAQLDFLRQLQTARPQMKIVLTSLSELDPAAQDLLDAGASAHIQKPLRADILAPKIREVLDA